MRCLTIFPADSEAFVRESADQIARAINGATAERGECILGLSGGSTPIPVYEALGRSTEIDWSKVKLFLVDDRYVAKTELESNQRLVRDSLLAHAPIPETQLLFPDTSLPLDACLATYVFGLINLFSAHAPDVLVLGMGEDGHIASLFPPVPEYAFGEELAIHTQTERFAIRDRISISPLVIMAAAQSFLLIRGEAKANLFDACLASAEADPVRYPLHVALATGNLTAIIQKDSSK